MRGMQKLNQAWQTMRGIRSTNLYKQLKGKKHQLNRTQAVLTAHENGCYARREQTLQHKVKLEQTKASNLWKKVDKQHAKLDTRLTQHEQTLRDLKNECHPGVQTHKEGYEELTDDVKKMTIILFAAQISAENCPHVILLSSLPSKRTVRRCADQGHVLAKIQVAETVVPNNFDIHMALLVTKRNLLGTK